MSKLIETLCTIWNKEGIRFVFVGVLNTIFGYIYYNFWLLLLPYQFALTASYPFGIMTSYLLNSYIVFREKPNLRKALQFPAVYVVQYVVSLVLVTIFVDYLGIHESPAFVLGVIGTIPFTFILSRFIIKSGGIFAH